MQRLNCSYKIIIVSAVLSGCETWSLKLREKDGLKVFEKREFREMFGSKRVETTGDRMRLQYEGMHEMHSAPNIIPEIKKRRMRLGGGVK